METQLTMSNQSNHKENHNDNDIGVIFVVLAIISVSYTIVLSKVMAKIWEHSNMWSDNQTVYTQTNSLPRLFCMGNLTVC